MPASGTKERDSLCSITLGQYKQLFAAMAEELRRQDEQLVTLVDLAKAANQTHDEFERAMGRLFVVILLVIVAGVALCLSMWYAIA